MKDRIHWTGSKTRWLRQDNSNNKEKYMQTYSITLQQDPLFWLGDKFYKVEEPRTKYGSSTRKRFESNCPSCNNTRKISYKGYDGKEYEAECPICKSSMGHGYGNHIELPHWEVHEYIVHKIEARGPKKHLCTRTE